MRCSICGKDVSAGEGSDTVIGFVCYDCYNARDFHLCAECGRRFPRDEMIEWNGLFYCREDYFRAKERMERILEEERKKKEKEELAKRPPLVKPGSGILVRERKRSPLTREDISQLIGQLNQRSEKGKWKETETNLREEISEKEREKEKRLKEFRTSRKEGNQKEEMKEIMKEISSVTFSLSKSADNAASFVSDSLLDKDSVSLSQAARKNRMNKISSLLNQLFSAGRKRGRKD
jgi:hypothetical protein